MSLNLKNIYFFQNLDKKLFNKVIENSEELEIKSGIELIKQGEKSDNNAYIIQQGIAGLIIDGRQIKTLKSGDIFGEIALITNEPRTASIKAITDLKLVKINKELLNNAIKNFTNGKEIQKIIMKRIKENLGY